MPRKAESLTVYLPNILLIGVDAPYNKTLDKDAYFQEFLNLAKSNKLVYKDAIHVKLREIDPGSFLTKGKLSEIKALCDKLAIDEVVISEPLTPQQERNMTDYLHCRVFDRTQLILEIFEKAAHSAEGKTQVAIAMMQHKKSRLAGKGIHMSQQAGTVGVRGGFGETAKEKEKRHIEESILKFRRQLGRLDQVRETQRKSRLNNQIPHICLIGYTNAGKSTIINTMTKSNVLAEDKLFATLDTTTRELFLEGKKKGVISDTVGFIQALPPQLIEAFKSTLSELKYADLLLQVVDLSDKNWEEHIKVVHKILIDLHVDKPMLFVFNKADCVDNLEFLQPTLARYQPHVIVSGTSKAGIKPLVEFLSQWEV
jgi:GTP-binding protein HflX